MCGFTDGVFDETLGLRMSFSSLAMFSCRRLLCLFWRHNTSRGGSIPGVLTELSTDEVAAQCRDI